MGSSVSVVRGTNKKPVASEVLVSFFSQGGGHEGYLFTGYPIIGTAEGRHPIDALLVSPSLGIVVFDLIEGTRLGDYQSRQDDSANKLEARLRPHAELVERRRLKIPITTVSFAPAIPTGETLSSGEYLLANVETLSSGLSRAKWVDPQIGVYEAAVSAIQNITAIRKSRIKRTVVHADSKGAKLKRLEDSIATLDTLQSRAVVETVDGVQRIRGLAGSGKTVVLALKAAYLHAQHPEWRIAVTFNTRSLKGQFRRFINNFSVEQTGEEPDWQSLRILSAWGAPGGGERDGLYHEFCQAHGKEYLDYRGAKARFGTDSAFASACELAIQGCSEGKPLYNAILVDESQDFPPEFLRLCFHALDKNKRLVYAYDELQNLSGASLPPPEEIFGKLPDGTPVVKFDEPLPGEPRRDVILEKCYRNSRPVLATAHALGFGVYREPPEGATTGLVQMFDHSELWEEIGYRVNEGQIRDGTEVTLYRTEDTSPKFLEEHSPVAELVQFICFNNREKQAEWLV